MPVVFAPRHDELVWRRNSSRRDTLSQPVHQRHQAVNVDLAAPRASHLVAQEAPHFIPELWGCHRTVTEEGQELLVDLRDLRIVIQCVAVAAQQDNVRRLMETPEGCFALHSHRSLSVHVFAHRRPVGEVRDDERAVDTASQTPMAIEALHESAEVVRRRGST